jgi:perosamine synthetase
MGHPYAVAVNSCTAALHLALDAVGVQRGDTVVVPTMTFAATGEVVRYFDADPLLVDCRAEDFNLDVTDTERRIEEAVAAGKKVTAIIPVHYGGQIGDMFGVVRLAHRFGLQIIVDAAHCTPSFYRENEDSEWQTVGAAADISCFSFYANKSLTTGEGGMACTAREEYAERMRVMSLHGLSAHAWERFSNESNWFYEIIAPGFKYNMTDIAASIGLHQVRKADLLHKIRGERTALYNELLSDVEELVLPRTMPNRISSYHLYVIRLKLDRLQINRATVIAELKRAGIATSVHWLPLHMHHYYRERYHYHVDDLPQAAALYPEIISLPLFPSMTEGDVTYVCESLRNILTRYSLRA